MTAIVTPFRGSGELDLGLVPDILEFQREAGIDGVVVAGTNGEGTSLTVDERKRLLEAVQRHRGSLTVVAATGAASVEDAIDLTRHAASAGSDAVLVLPPFFYKGPTSRGVSAYFRRVMDASAVPVLLYSIPQHSGVAITDEILDELSDHPRLAGLKDSQGSWERTSALLRERSHLTVLPGADELLGRALMAGAPGGISGTANPFPELVAAVKRAADGGGDVSAAQARLDAAKNLLSRYPIIGVSKSILAHRGLPRMAVRPPLVDLTEQQERQLIDDARRLGLLD